MPQWSHGTEQREQKQEAGSCRQCVSHSHEKRHRRAGPGSSCRKLHKRVKNVLTDFQSAGNSVMKTLMVLSCWCQLQVLGSIMVKSERKLSAAVGKNVTLLCQLMTIKENVIQITWQKESGNFTGTVATTSKAYGQKLLGYYTKRAKHSTNNIPNVSAITISPVTPEDEGCFRCIFNLFPLGASTGIVCLDVYEAYLLEPYLDVLEIAQPDLLDKLHTVTCSATGKPAPSITWILPEKMDITPETYTIINSNTTETVISNFTLTISTMRDVPVTCVVQHPSLSSERYLSTVIEGTRNQDSDRTLFIIIGITTIVSLCFVFGLVWIIRSGKCKQDKMRDSTSTEVTLLCSR